MTFLKITKDDKIGWKIFFSFFVYTYITINVLVRAMGGQVGLIGDPINLKFLIDISVFILTVFAFFCFAWDKRLFNKLFWQMFFVLGILWRIGILTTFIVSFNLWGELSFPFIAFYIIPTLSLFVILPLVALYFYAFCSDIWNY